MTGLEAAYGSRPLHVHVLDKPLVGPHGVAILLEQSLRLSLAPFSISVNSMREHGGESSTLLDRMRRAVAGLAHARSWQPVSEALLSGIVAKLKRTLGETGAV